MKSDEFKAKYRSGVANAARAGGFTVQPEQAEREFDADLDALLAAMYVQTLGEASVIAGNASSVRAAREDIKKVQKAFIEHREAGPRLLAEHLARSKKT